METNTFPTTVYFFLLIELLAVSYIDLIQKKIANLWSIINLSVFSILILLFPGIYSLNLKSFSYSIIFLGAGFILFLLKIMGGGDSKYLSTMFLLIPTNFQDLMMISLIYTTLAIGVMVLLFNTVKNIKSIFQSIKNRRIDRIKLIYGKKLTYAPVILIAWIIFGWINRSILF